MPADSLSHADVVEVRSPAEILATLDSRGTLDGLPFMPEMIQFCGKRFVVDRRGEKICDTIYPLASRRLPDTVLLEELRCAGSAHDGCQADCRIFWKEAWLRRVVSPDGLSTARDDAAQDQLTQLTQATTRRDSEAGDQPGPRYHCQATELHRASLPLRTFDPRPYVREFTSGNVGLIRFLKVTARAAVREPLRKLGLDRKIPLRGSLRKSGLEPALNLQPGEVVKVKERNEIAATLTPHGKNRGLWFDEEMLPFCGRTFRVRQRVERFIDDRTAQMIELKTDSVTLEGAVCSGDRSPVRWFCPREIYPYWREIWLERVESDVPAAAIDAPTRSTPS
jgi:hypothetical protein